MLLLELFDETRVQYKSQFLREALEDKDFELSRTKTVFMECKFSNRRQSSKD